jgi:LPXTG-motif cell wall-anchored protein
VNSSAFSLPVRRAAAVLTTTALAVGPAVLIGAPAAQATGGEGKAGAVVLRAALDVDLLNKTADVPLDASLNEVQAPASADKTALTVKVDGVDKGRPVSVLRADVASARATVDPHKAEGSAKLVRAKAHVPGLPLLSLIEVEQVTAQAVCAAGKKPTAESNLLGTVRVLGKEARLSARGTATVAVPGVGTVRLELSKANITSHSAAATALDLKVSVKPLKRNVAAVDGRVTLVEATCERPKAAPGQEEPGAEKPEEEKPEVEKPGAANPQDEEPDVSTQTGTVGEKENLAETGGSSTTPYLAGAAALLIAGGAGALVITRRRRRS